mgnify:CR=1 FL=1
MSAVCRVGIALVVLMSAAFPEFDAIAGTPGTGRANATRSVVYAAHGMVACAQPLAAQAGLDLPEALMNELCASYPAFEAMVRRLPRARLKSDEPAHHCVAPARIAKLDR